LSGDKSLVRGQQRQLGIDALRGIAVIFMLLQHLLSWFWDITGQELRAHLAEHTLSVTLLTLGNLSAPLFIVLAGVGSVFFLQKHPEGSLSLVRRSLVLIAFGYILNLAAGNWFEPGSWYILHLIGFGLLCAPFLQRLLPLVLLSTIAFVIIASVLAQVFLDTPMNMGNIRLSDSSLPGGAVRLALVEGHFPVLPWLALFIFGMVFGKWYLRNQIRFVGLCTVVCAILGISFASAPMIWPEILQQHVTARLFAFSTVPFPLTPSLLLIMAALTGAGFLFFASINTRVSRSLTYTSACLGRASLSIFIIHIVLFRQISEMLGGYKILSEEAALTSTLIVIILFTILSLWWRKYDYRYSLEWLLRKAG